jgi:Ras-related protein Rab-1A
MVIGDTDVGRTRMMLHYMDPTFTGETMPTIGVQFEEKVAEIDGANYKVQIWDTAGQGRCRVIAERCYRGTHGIVLVYDVTRQETFTDLRDWFDSIAEHSATAKPLILCGNKCDLAAVVSFDDAEDLARAKGIELFLTSAMSGEGIEDAFLAICRKVIRRRSAGAAGGGKEDVVLDREQGKGKKRKERSACVV